MEESRFKHVPLLKKLCIVFPRDQRLRFVGLFFLILIGTVFDFFSVSMILPFVSVLVNPASLESASWYQFLQRIIGAESTMDVLFALTVILIGVYVVKNIYMMLLSVIQNTFLTKNRFHTSAKLLNCYMHKPYTFHLQHNLAEIMRSINTDVGNAFSLVMNLISLVAAVLISIALVIFLISVDPILTFSIVIALAICSGLYFLIVRSRMRAAGQESRRLSMRMYKAMHQSMGGIKEVKVMGREQYFVDAYSSNGVAYVKNQRKYVLLSGLPKHLIEIFCVGGVLSVVAIKIASHADLSSLVPTLTAFGIAAVRLLPSANQINSIINSISFHMPSLDSICENITDSLSEEPAQRTRAVKKRQRQEQDISIDHITFTYPNTDEPVLRDVSLNIRRGTSVGIVGVTGAGKTTLVDIILGLLEPQQGRVLYGGVDIRDDYAEWQSHIGYIPQSIYLTDETIRANVALGVYDDQIDDARVWKALEDAQLADFVRGLKDGLDTVVGERGVRLSGGQRQRIGIARALYYDPDILFFDEATSSLDNDTEKAVMASINQLSKEKTIIVIAHRLTTIENCDYIYKVEDGKVFPTTLD